MGQLRDYFIQASSSIVAALIVNGHDPELRDTDFEESKKGDYVTVKKPEGIVYVPTSFETHHDTKMKKYRMVTDKGWRLSRDACEIAASIVDISSQYEFPDELTLEPTAIGLYPKSSIYQTEQAAIANRKE